MLAAVSLLHPALADGAARLQVAADSIEWQGIVAHRVDLSLVPAGPSGLGVSVYATRVDGLAALGVVSQFRFACARVAVSAQRIDCRAGRLSGDLGQAGPQQTPVSLLLQADGRLAAALPSLTLAGGTASLQVDSQEGRWRATGSFSGVDPGLLGAIPALAGLQPAGLTLRARADGSIEANGAGDGLDSMRLRASITALSFSDEPGSLAGEGLALEADAAFAWRVRSRDWQVDSRLAARGGQAYVDPVFLDLDAHPATLEFSGVLADDASSLEVVRYRYEQADVGRVEGAATLDLAGETLLRKASLQLRDIAVAGALPIYVAPFLVGTQLSDMQGLGRVRGEVGVTDGLPDRIAVELEDVTLDSVTGAVAVEGLAGPFNWFSEELRNELGPASDSAIFKSQLSWRSARLWGLEFGPTSLPFTTTGNHFRLLDPVLIPVFDGGLAIETLRIRHAGEPDMYLRFDAELRPVSIGRLTRALGWPEFSGTLAGRIPRLELADGLVTLGGNIEAQAFDGTVTVSNLRLRDPLGQFPQLFADIDVDRLDLAQVTSTFEFGMITGRLSGRVRGLETFDWMPVAFDASFYSTPGDKSKRRIDQRAVSNLSSIGGGSGGSVASALQGGFLRFFDSFGYDRLGLSCRLENDVCHMDGVARADTGYYIVKGSGLPRIDVIGSQRSVAWSRLVRQLAAITQSPGPVIE
jgi:hypothetical protein